jgi:hypothetical protein
VNWSALDVADVPPALVTVMSTVPAASAGAVAVTRPSALTVNELAAAAPKYTPVAPVKPLPVIVTTAPPAVPPVAGLTAVTVGVAE